MTAKLRILVWQPARNLFNGVCLVVDLDGDLRRFCDKLVGHGRQSGNGSWMVVMPVIHYGL